jgi:hypothetical protein
MGGSGDGSPLLLVMAHELLQILARHRDVRRVPGVTSAADRSPRTGADNVSTPRVMNSRKGYTKCIPLREVRK